MKTKSTYLSWQPGKGCVDETLKIFLKSAGRLYFSRAPSIMILQFHEVMMILTITECDCSYVTKRTECALKIEISRILETTVVKLVYTFDKCLPLMSEKISQQLKCHFLWTYIWTPTLIGLPCLYIMPVYNCFVTQEFRNHGDYKI